MLIAASVASAPATAAPVSIAGMIVFLDPGHNGANDASLTKQVPTGRGGTKDCQTSGTTANDGYPEHSFNWETVLRIRQELTALGVRTAMSRGDDTSVAACVDARADLTGLNLAQYPAVLVECGNMKNPADAALLESPEGRQKYADAIVKGIAGFLGTRPPRTA